MRLKAENVFKPGAYPEYTYVSRNYENTGISYRITFKAGIENSGLPYVINWTIKNGKDNLMREGNWI